jgi:flagellar export protein FliJ
MARQPPYRLQALYDLREKAKEEAEEHYAEKRRAVAEQEKILDDMKQQLRDMAAAREARKHEYAEKMRSGELNVNQINANDRHIEKLKQEEQAFQVEIQRQGERVREAEAEAEEAMQAMLAATQELKALEKHKEKWLKQVKREQMLKEEDAADDIAQAQYFQRMREDRDD